MSLKPKVALSQNFLFGLSKIPAKVQPRIFEWTLKFQNNPTANGINYEKLPMCKDDRLRSVRLSNDWRGIVFKPPKGDVFLLLHVDHHDKAYRWAKNRKMEVNPYTGALQVVLVEEVVKEENIQVQANTTLSSNPPLFSDLDDKDLARLGTPLDMIPQVRQVVARTPKRECRQTLLFSATFTPEIVELGSRWAMDPIMVEVEPEQVAAEAVNQIVYLVTTADKYNLLYNLITEPESKKVLVFSNRRDQVRRLADNLYRNGINCGALSGEIPQNKRIRTLDAFKTGKLRVLVATDVAGRGLHISDVTHVVNYTLPEEAGDYVHRIGRTGRAGAVGTSISFACEEDSFLLPAIEEKLGHKLDCIHPEEDLLERAPGFVREVQSRPRPDNRGNSRSRGSRRH
ncbi:MAG TPA: hypothetical protein EYO00_02225 [Gammaproteobacteria bacterium]|nr:hypothetical protein [Gammaproteobacteria bacterium]